MSGNIANSAAYLRNTRNFPEEIKSLTVEVNKAYLDTATAINERTIGFFPTTRSAVTGESWYLVDNQRQQGFRQVYTFTSFADIQLGFKISSVGRFVRGFGSYSDGSNWYGILFATSTAIPGNVSFFIFLDGTSTTSDIIRFNSAGAPAISGTGTVVLEWISQSLRGKYV